MSYLILVRHGQSEWNEKGLWTGWTDVSLNDTGRGEAKNTALALKGLPVDTGYSSDQIRAKETLSIILGALDIKIPVKETPALRERNYGVYTGKNKWEVKESVGDVIFQKIRRSYDYPIQDGESLKQVYDRVAPFYESEILPEIRNQKNIIIVASGNSLRALVKKLENISDENISSLEIRTAESYVYELDSEGNIVKKEIRAKNPIAV
jgi:2,3-bisphosphoglycerate-dependent phosphoglycerate mutase